MIRNFADAAGRQCFERFAAGKRIRAERGQCAVQGGCGQRCVVRKGFYADFFCAVGGDLDTENARDPLAKEKYPYFYLTKNSLYRVHATYSNSPFLLELQENTPRVYMNPDDIAASGIAEGTVVEVYNSRGVTAGMLVGDAGMHAGQVVFEQGWWSGFTAGMNYNTLIWPWINPTNEVYYVSSVWSPNMAWNECCCNIREASPKVKALFEEQRKKGAGMVAGGTDVLRGSGKAVM